MDLTKQLIDLNAGWYNVVAEALKLDPATFMLAQGTLGLQTADSSGLFQMSDAVPPPSAVAYFDSAGMSKRSSAYGLLLQALLPEGGSDLRDVLRDQYSDWVAFLPTYLKANPGKTQLEAFNAWSEANMDPRAAAKAKTTFILAQNAPLYNALVALSDPNAKAQFVDTARKPFSLYIYSATSTAATDAINKGGSAKIDFDSATSNKTLTHRTIEGAASGFYNIFSGEASASFDQLNTTAASSRLTISGTLNKYATLSVVPGSWFTSSELLRAYNGNNDNNVWDPNAGSVGSWNSFFGDKGSLARRVSQLILVSDYDITVTSFASYSQNDLQQISTKASFGVWPFFSAGATATQKTEFSLDQNGHLVTKYHLNPGLIQIWGVNVQSAPN